MAEVVWLATATANLNEIAAYIRQHDLRAADSYTLRLQQAGDSLRDFPHRGRPAARGRRELVGIWPYIIRYRVVDDTVFIIEVRHMRRHKPTR